MIHPLICKEKSTRLTIIGEQFKKLIEKPKAILWCRDGLYGMLPVEVVKNAIAVNSDVANIVVVYGGLQRKQFEFNWGETVEIPVETGLSMEEYNGKDGN